MQKPLAHPFTITVALNKPLRDTFSWAIGQPGEVRRQSRTTYATFEEARLAGKSALDEMIAAWQRKAVHSAAA
ncbi:hypothetical protein [Methylobacterium soli]|uniref:Uncharacterized protein n=1 Tax=Methylobacterium soli TaxID=553447 RepID=A0A6L3SQD0_9HYPH|nr:hypothetical protein [Methylobacterium soli]KAB1071116.1 hypothetical protein F6X53_29305 [Methylobacterium soli]GJE42740.1 hypothetical protein AEGHOMDF_1913 [Methylobacterium soli]